MRPVRVECSRRIVEDFKKLAIQAFDKEVYGVFLGRRQGNLVRIKDLWIPEKQENNTDGGAETIMDRKSWREEVEAYADSTGLEVVGDIHSHCYRSPASDRAPSETDWNGISGRPWVLGICTVVMRGRGRRQKLSWASVRLWPWIPQVVMKYGG